MNDSLAKYMKDDDYISQQLFDLSKGIVLQLPDLAFKASASCDENHSPENCRIGAPHRSKKSWAWCAKSNGDHIIVDLTASYLVTGVATQGRGDYAAQYVTQYKLETSENGIDWIDHGRFVGNFDQVTICKRKLKKPICASFVKFTILQSNLHTSMRLDVLVYKK